MDTVTSKKNKITTTTKITNDSNKSSKENPQPKNTHNEKGTTKPRNCWPWEFGVCVLWRMLKLSSDFNFYFFYSHASCIYTLSKIYKRKITQSHLGAQKVIKLQWQ